MKLSLGFQNVQLQHGGRWKIFSFQYRDENSYGTIGSGQEQLQYHWIWGSSTAVPLDLRKFNCGTMGSEQVQLRYHWISESSTAVPLV
jgi:hypothetical protein